MKQFLSDYYTAMKHEWQLLIEYWYVWTIVMIVGIALMLWGRSKQ